jgi:hypothetical protein
MIGTMHKETECLRTASVGQRLNEGFTFKVNGSKRSGIQIW